MSLAKAIVTGTVYRAPEKRFTQNNVAVSDFVLDLGGDTLIKVVSKRQALDELVASTQKGDVLLVEGRLQTAAVKADDGSEKRFFEIDANVIEKFGSGVAPASSSNFGTEEIVKFESDDFSNELIGEDEIPF